MFYYFKTKTMFTYFNMIQVFIMLTVASFRPTAVSMQILTLTEISKFAKSLKLKRTKQSKFPGLHSVFMLSAFRFALSCFLTAWTNRRWFKRSWVKFELSSFSSSVWRAALPVQISKFWSSADLFVHLVSYCSRVCLQCLSTFRKYIIWYFVFLQSCNLECFNQESYLKTRKTSK